MMRPLLLAALLLFPATACAQDSGSTPRPPITGGWSAAEVTPEIEEIAVWAFNEIDVPGAELLGIENVSRQAVAGINYRMDLVFTDKRRWRVQVYRRFNGEKQLTSAEQVAAR